MPDQTPIELPRTWRPLGPRIASAVAISSLVVVVGLLWFGFDEETKQAVTVFQRGTVIFLGLLAFSVLFALIRSRATATEAGLTVVNGYRTHHYEWPQVLAVRFPQGAPWVTLDLADGTSGMVIAIQASDGARAVTAVRELRALVDRQP